MDNQIQNSIIQPPIIKVKYVGITSEKEIWVWDPIFSTDDIDYWRMLSCPIFTAIAPQFSEVERMCFLGCGYIVVDTENSILHTCKAIYKADEIILIEQEEFGLVTVYKTLQGEVIARKSSNQISFC